MHASRDQDRHVHRVKTDWTFGIILYREISENLVCKSVGVSRRCVSFLKPLDQCLYVDIAFGPVDAFFPGGNNKIGMEDSTS